MKGIIRSCIYQGKNLYRDFGFSFWCLIYPLIMAVFFYTAFSGIMNVQLENVNVGINSENPMVSVLENIEFINVHKISNDAINNKLESGDIHGFIDNDLNLLVKGSGINQTIIKEIIEQIKQMQKLDIPIEKFDFTIDYLVDRNQKADTIIIAFYSLIAMVSTYGIFCGIESVSLIQANLSNIGARINVTPLRKFNFLLSGVIVTLLLNLVSNGILLIFIKTVLKIDLFNEIKYSAIFIILGNLFGVALGIFIGSSNKKSTGVKTMIGILVTLFLSFLSGMMGTWMKVMVDQHIPILNKLNPISVITNNLYRINLLENTKNVNEGIFVLVAYCIVLIFISYGFLRRRNYDSI